MLVMVLGKGNWQLSVNIEGWEACQSMFLLCVSWKVKKNPANNKQQHKLWNKLELWFGWRGKWSVPIVVLFVTSVWWTWFYTLSSWIKVFLRISNILSLLSLLVDKDVKEFVQELTLPFKESLIFFPTFFGNRFPQWHQNLLLERDPCTICSLSPRHLHNWQWLFFFSICLKLFF